MGKSTVRDVLLQVAKVINNVLLQRVATLGNIDTNVNGFAALGFPRCRGP